MNPWHHEPVKLGLPLTPNEDAGHGNANCHHDDEEGPKSPAPGHFVVKEVSNLRSGEDSCNSRRAIDAEQKYSILKRSHVGQHNANNYLEILS